MFFYYFFEYVKKNIPEKFSPLRGDFYRSVKILFLHSKTVVVTLEPPQAKHFGVLARSLSIFPLISVLKISNRSELG